MIQRLSHVTLYVLDQDEAHDFYTRKLGLEVRTDARMEGFRWLTLGAPSQPDVEIALMPIHPSPMMEGVEFLSPPEQRPYGIEATFKDSSGNWFSLTQHG